MLLTLNDECTTGSATTNVYLSHRHLKRQQIHVFISSFKTKFMLTMIVIKYVVCWTEYSFNSLKDSRNVCQRKRFNSWIKIGQWNYNMFILILTRTKSLWKPSCIVPFLVVHSLLLQAVFITSIISLNHCCLNFT